VCGWGVNCHAVASPEPCHFHAVAMTWPCHCHATTPQATQGLLCLVSDGRRDSFVPLFASTCREPVRMPPKAIAGAVCSDGLRWLYWFCAVCDETVVVSNKPSARRSYAARVLGIWRNGLMIPHAHGLTVNCFKCYSRWIRKQCIKFLIYAFCKKPIITLAAEAITDFLCSPHYISRCRVLIDGPGALRPEAEPESI
jgi:hypothetical protein